MCFIGPCTHDAKHGVAAESAQAKNGALRDAGAVVPDSYEGFEAAIKCVGSGSLMNEALLQPIGTLIFVQGK